MAAIPILAGAAVIGSGLEVYGNIKAAQQKSDAVKAEAALKEAQANELLDREKINEGLMQEQESSIESGYVSAFADTGREGGGIGGVIKLRNQLQKNIDISRREASFKAQMLRAGANIDTTLASQQLSASYIGGAGTILTRGAEAYSAFKK